LFNRNTGIISITSSNSFNIFKTKTVASLLQTTITSTSTLYCVPLIEFVGGTAYQTACSAVGRRRRNLINLLDLLEDAKRNEEQDQDLEEFESIISPYQVEP